MQMKKEKKNFIQIPLLDVIRIKKIGLTSKEIKRIKLHLYREGSKILSIIIKPADKKDEMRRDGKQLFF